MTILFVVNKQEGGSSPTLSVFLFELFVFFLGGLCRFFVGGPQAPHQNINNRTQVIMIEGEAVGY